MSRISILLLSLSSILAVTSPLARETAAEVQLQVSPSKATVGDRLQASMSVRLPRGYVLQTGIIGPQFGPLVVAAESWSGPQSEGDTQLWTWNGTLISFRTGEIEIPAIPLGFQRADGSRESVASPARLVLIESVLLPEETAEGELPEISDNKAQLSLQPDYSSLWTALALLLLLLVAVALLFWLRRRYAARLARVKQPQHPFQRIPPHLWVYDELQALLDRRLVERDQVERFFMELSRIVKLYLGGRYRANLMESTSGEVPVILARSGTPEPAIAKTVRLLGLADGVKFAGEHPDPARCRRAVESAYGIVDSTKPIEADVAPDERGVA